MGEDQADSIKMQVCILGDFTVVMDHQVIRSQQWPRERALQLFQFFLIHGLDQALHREQIIDRLWPEESMEGGIQLFKVALHTISKTLEPGKPSRAPSGIILRTGHSYRMSRQGLWIDSEVMAGKIGEANAVLHSNPDTAASIFEEAVRMYAGPVLPDRIFEDWTSGYREHIQMLVLTALCNLSQLQLSSNPSSSIQYAQRALLIDETWEDAYRLLINALIKSGNRPKAIEVYKRCERVLEEQYGISPLPQTTELVRQLT